LTSEVWDTLIDIQDHLIDKFKSTGVEIHEHGMDRFNQPGWVNRVWTSETYRRAHIDVVDARESKGLWMMHCCVFPHLTNNGPIFGLDVIAGERKITGFFHDYSRTVTATHPMIEALLQQLLDLSLDSIGAYLTDIGDFNKTSTHEKGKEAQNRYAHFQKQNPHTPRTMTSLGLNEDDVRIFVQECLFPDIA